MNSMTPNKAVAEDTPRISLPNETYRLEEINLPEDLAQQLAGRVVAVEILPEELPGTRRVDILDSPALIARDGGTVWNDYRPAHVSFKDKQGRRWNLPRHWQLGPRRVATPPVEADCQVFKECQFTETVHLPSAWDLMDTNILSGEADRAGGKPTEVLVHIKPQAQTRVFWRDSSGQLWRIPHDWRRRRVRLPSCDILVAQGIPEGVAERFGGAVVSVNYHPGSLCCLEDGYRFRDEQGNRWPVLKRDCLVLGFGSKTEARA